MLLFTATVFLLFTTLLVILKAQTIATSYHCPHPCNPLLRVIQPARLALLGSKKLRHGQFHTSVPKRLVS